MAMNTPDGLPCLAAYEMMERIREAHRQDGSQESPEVGIIVGFLLWIALVVGGVALCDYAFAGIGGGPHIQFPPKTTPPNPPEPPQPIFPLPQNPPDPPPIPFQKACYLAFADEPPREENPLCDATHDCVDECVSIGTGEYVTPARETLIVIAKCAEKCEVLLHCPDFSFPRKEN